MARASQHQQSSSPIFRLNQPDRLDLNTIMAGAPKTQRGAWRYLAGIFDSAQKKHCQQFSIEPDSTLWRLRYHMIEGYEEHIISDPSVIIWALDALQIALWDDEFHKMPNRSARFVWTNPNTDLAIKLRVVQTVKGDMLEFDVEPVLPMPPLLDELGLEPTLLQALRHRLQTNQGMLLLTSSNQVFLDNALMAINQDLVTPERKLLSISDRHRFSLPRTVQIDMHELNPIDRQDAWQKALDTCHDVLLSASHVPELYQEQIADRCDQGTLTVQTMRVARATDAMQLLNASILRRAPLHRAVTSVLSHFPVTSICSECRVQAQLNVDEQQWLEQLRTPATENVISWLADGNAEQFMTGEGCEACADSGCGQPLSVFNLQHRDEMTNQFAELSATSQHQQGSALQRQLMSLAKKGKISLNEVIRVIASV